MYQPKYFWQLAIFFGQDNSIFKKRVIFEIKDIFNKNFLEIMSVCGVSATVLYGIIGATFCATENTR